MMLGPQISPQRDRVRQKFFRTNHVANCTYSRVLMASKKANVFKFPGFAERPAVLSDQSQREKADF